MLFCQALHDRYTVFHTGSMPRVESRYIKEEGFFSVHADEVKGSV